MLIYLQILLIKVWHHNWVFDLRMTIIQVWNIFVRLVQFGSPLYLSPFLLKFLFFQKSLVSLFNLSKFVLDSITIAFLVFFQLFYLSLKGLLNTFPIFWFWFIITSQKFINLVLDFAIYFFYTDIGYFFFISFMFVSHDFDHFSS